MKVFIISFALTFFIASASSRTYCEICKCEHGANVSVIDCEFRELFKISSNKNEWPEFLTQSVYFANVKMGRNYIQKVTQFPYLPNIYKLSLRCNSILDIETSAFLNLQNLVSLDLSHNQLTAENIRADVLRGQPSNEQYEPLQLQTLDLGYNNINSLDPKAFEHLPYLSELYLNNNPLNQFDDNLIAAISLPERLKILSLSNTQLRSLDKKFGDLTSIRKSLEILYLNGNNFVEVPSVLSELGKTLLELNMNANPIEIINDTSFLGLQNLRKLSISSMPNLKRIGPASFDQLIYLQILECSHNPRLSDVDKDAFRELRSLKWSIKEIYLQHNALASLPEDLMKWSQIDILHLEGNPWNCNCELSWMIQLLEEPMYTILPYFGSQIICEMPFHLSGASLLSFKNHSETFCLESENRFEIKEKFPAHIIAFIVALTFAVFVCLALVYVHFKKRFDVNGRNLATAHLNILYNKCNIVPS